VGPALLFRGADRPARMIGEIVALDDDLRLSRRAFWIARRRAVELMRFKDVLNQLTGRLSGALLGGGNLTMVVDHR
jgi:hypothetical protein